MGKVWGKTTSGLESPVRDWGRGGMVPRVPCLRGSWGTGRPAFFLIRHVSDLTRGAGDRTGLRVLEVCTGLNPFARNVYIDSIPGVLLR